MVERVGQALGQDVVEVGVTVVLMARFDAAHALQLIAQYNATVFEGVPAMYAMLVNAPDIGQAQLSTLTRSTVGGQTIGLSLITEWERRSGAPLLELWGMTELAGLGRRMHISRPTSTGRSALRCPEWPSGLLHLPIHSKPRRWGSPANFAFAGP